MKIRHSTPNDYNDLKPLFQTVQNVELNMSGIIAVLNDSYNEYLRMINEPSTEIIVFILSGKIVGFTILMINHQLVGHILYIWTHPKCRKKNIGSSLLGAAKRWFKNRGINRIQITLPVNDLGTSIFLANHGFKVKLKTFEAKIKPN